MIQIKTGMLNNAQIQSLLKAHHADMLQHSPPESVHALNLKAFEAPEITFWSFWIDDELAGCGALKELSDEHGEIKSMRTCSTHLRKGIADKLLKHIINEARNRSYNFLSLETGSMAVFEPAQKLYKKFGFDYCEPFADYVKDPYSVFMNKKL